jgi:hypothetical protein
MGTRKSFSLTLATIGLAAITGRQSTFGQETLAWRILKWSEADQVSWINSTLDKGMPLDLGGVMNMLVLNKSSLTLPLIEKKIEEVLHSASPLECFTNKEVDPRYFVDIAALTITEAGDEQALREAGKLIKLDDKRFGKLVDRTLGHAQNRRNPFTLAYRGFEIGDPALDEKIMAWAEEQLANKDQYAIVEVRRFWAEALLDKYRGVPVSSEWASDPIVSRLRAPQAASLHNEMIRFTSEAFEKRSKH